MHRDRLSRHRFGSAGRRLLPVVVALPMMLTGCSAVSRTSGDGGGITALEAPVGVEHPGTTPVDSQDPAVDPTVEEVLSAWMAAQQAFEVAALTADPHEPDLAATMLRPQLDVSVSALTDMRNAGDVAEGTPTWGVPQVQVGPGGTATVRACLHDSEITVNKASRVPVQGILGQIADESFTSLLRLTASGWKLTDQTVRDSSCTVS